MAVLNIMEQIIKDKVVENIEKDSTACKCTGCIDDVVCIVLNHTPSKYVRTEKGVLFSKATSLLDNQHIVDIDVSIISAIEFVKKHPKHDN